MNKKEIQEVKELLDTTRGNIISSTSRIEFILGSKLQKYFFPKRNNKSTILFWNVLNPMTFDDKISLYESLPYFKKLRGYPKIKEALRFIQKLRNIMAHWDLSENRSNLQNINMFTLVGKYRTIDINQSLMEDFYKNINFLLKRFGYSR